MQEYFYTKLLITTCTIYESKHKTGVCTEKKKKERKKKSIVSGKIVPFASFICTLVWNVGSKKA